MTSWEEEMLDKFFNNVKSKGKGSICSTCKYFDGKTCSKGRSFAGFASKLSDCDDEWEVCGG